MKAQDEFRLACVVADYLALTLPPRVLWSHLPFGEQRSAVTGARLKRMGTKKGWADYLVIHDGGILALELKAPKGKQSPEQKDFADALVAAGGAYHVCRSLDDVKTALQLSAVPMLAVTW